MSKWCAWTPAEDRRLEELVAAGLEWREIAKVMRRPYNGCKGRAQKLKLRHSSAVVLENRKKGRERFRADPAKVEQRLERLKARYTPEERANLAAEAKANPRFRAPARHTPETIAKIRAKATGKRLSPEHRAKIAKAKRAYWNARRKPPEEPKRNPRLAQAAAIAQARAAMRNDASRQSTSFREDLPPPVRVASWCTQCEARVYQRCASNWCKGPE